ncbi:MAG: histidine phosphatase family protein [Rhizobiaceae bacterium]
MTGAVLRYLTHPQVNIDPDVPVPEWGLSDVGAERVHKLCNSHTLTNIKNIVSSAETKATEAAQILGTFLGITPEIREKMHENDRSSTGFLESALFEDMADRFFASPDVSVKGWESASAAQARIVGEVQTVLASHKEGDLLLVGHGAVGTLLYCHFSGLPIDRKHDQTGGGGGNFITIEIASLKVLHGWQPMEEM